MKEQDRESGDGLVRLDALKWRYRDAKHEADLESALADELSAQGWTVHRQIWCRPMDENRFRRIDLYAVGTVFGWNESFPICLGIELKDDSGMKQTREAALQIGRYRRASVWCDESAALMAPPTWLAFTNRFLLGGVERGLYPGELWNRMLWEKGSSILARGQDGNLSMSFRLPKLIDRGERSVLTTRDTSVALTRWKTRRAP